MRLLPDVNVLVALGWNDHVHHQRAVDWLAQEAQAGWATCLLTQSGFLRLSLNLKAVGRQIDFADAISALQRMTADPAHEFFWCISIAHDD